MTEVSVEPIKAPRLKFIDMARSIAILMMLEGHFTGAALSWDYRKNEYLAYDIWHNIHGLTSPLFFTVTGVIFVYLLTAKGAGGYFTNIRVKKGFRRVLTLLFWGYFIQLNLWSIGQSVYYGSEFHMNWFYAFHVLQSIGVGIFFLLVIYGIYKLINKGAVYWYYLFGALVVFGFYAQMKAHITWDDKLIELGKMTAEQRRFLPKGAPLFIQNMFYGQFSDFSILRYAGYTLMGGMIGSIIRTFEHKTREWWFGASFIAVGILISSFIQAGLHQIDNLTENWGWVTEGRWEMNATHFIRLGQVITVLGLLMLVDAYFNVKAKLFLKVGQNTLPIYIVHVIILYGGIFGFGLKPLAFDENLGPWQAILISMSAMIFFVIMVKYIEPLERIYFKVKNILFF
jgi:fucose 4-O-acetylase-like acetyltransferase